ncbi:hypothetical protein CEXT_72471, partial [Caerostris extrusa]
MDLSHFVIGLSVGLTSMLSEALYVHPLRFCCLYPQGSRLYLMLDHYKRMQDFCDLRTEASLVKSLVTFAFTEGR